MVSPDSFENQRCTFHFHENSRNTDSKYKRFETKTNFNMKSNERITVIEFYDQKVPDLESFLHCCLWKLAKLTKRARSENGKFKNLFDLKSIGLSIDSSDIQIFRVLWSEWCLWWILICKRKHANGCDWNGISRKVWVFGQEIVQIYSVIISWER